jgi:hypothetical protein
LFSLFGCRTTGEGRKPMPRPPDHNNAESPMANPMHLKVVSNGRKAIAQWQKENPGGVLDLSEVDLRSYVKKNEGLRNCDLRFARMRRSNLSGLKLDGANLYAANLCEANLCGATLTNAELHGTFLGFANLDGVDFKGARLRFTVFAGSDLSGAKNLELVVHEGPSEISISTLVATKAPLPEPFLIACGVHKKLLRHVQSPPTKMKKPSCFVSYSRRDWQFVKLLSERLTKRGFAVYYDLEMGGGWRIVTYITQYINSNDKVILVLSGSSMKSEWVKTEIDEVIESQASQYRDKLVPIAIVPFQKVRVWKRIDDTGRDIAKFVREFNVVDFSKWKTPSEFAKSFALLVKGLLRDSEYRGRHR